MLNVMDVVNITFGKEKASNNPIFGREYSGGPCPFCKDGTNRFKVFPDYYAIPGYGSLGMFWCYGQRQGRAGCGKRGDAVEYIQQSRGLSVEQACRVIDIPVQVYARERKKPAQKVSSGAFLSHADSSDIWREQAGIIAYLAHRCLLSDKGKPGYEYLRSRGITEQTMQEKCLGYSAAYAFQDAERWGFFSDEPGQEKKKVLLPRGIFIPWLNRSGEVVCMRVRRLPEDISPEAVKYYGEHGRYWSIKGSSTKHLYNESRLFPGADTLLLEGELDAMITEQCTNESAVIVATGSTSGSRSDAVYKSLAGCATVLVGYNADSAGDKAAQHWLDRVKGSRRWRPLWDDANAMAQDGIDLQTWLDAGLQRCEPHTRDVCVVCGKHVDECYGEGNYVEVNETYAEFYCSQHLAIAS